MQSGQSESPTHIDVFRIFVHTVCPRLHGVNLRTYPPFFIFFSKNFKREERERPPSQHWSNNVPTLFRPSSGSRLFFFLIRPPYLHHTCTWNSMMSE